MVAFFGPVKHAAAGTHLLEELIFLHHKQVILELAKVPLGIHIINLRKYLRDVGIIFLASIAISCLSISVCDKFKGQHSILIGGDLLAEVSIPGLISAVRAHDSSSVKPLKILFFYLQGYADLNIGKILLKVFFSHHIVAARRADCIQNGRLAGAILPHQYQCILNSSYMHISYRFEIPYP